MKKDKGGQWIARDDNLKYSPVCEEQNNHEIGTILVVMSETNGDQQRQIKTEWS